MNKKKQRQTRQQPYMHRKNAAYHEAAHIVVAHLKGVNVVKASCIFDPVNDKGGFTEYDDTIQAISNDNYIMIKLAGCVGEELWCADTYGEVNFEQEADLSAMVGEHGEEDFQHARAYNYSNDELVQLNSITRTILKASRADFDRVVSLLVSKGSVNRKDIEEMFNSRCA